MKVVGRRFEIFNLSLTTFNLQRATFLLTLPSLLLSFILASLIGVAFYLVFGRGWLQLAGYWLIALIAFALGQILSTIIGTRLLPIGSVNALEASATCLIALFVTRTLWKG